MSQPQPPHEPGSSPADDTAGPAEVSADGTRKPAAVPLPKHLAHLRRDARGYPVLVTIPQSLGHPDFGMLSDRRKLAAATFDVCGVCALPFTDDELRWQVSFADPGRPRWRRRAHLQQHPHLGGDAFSETPLHDICALYAAQVCPFVSSPYARHGRDTELRGRRRPDSVVMLGYDDTRFAAGSIIGANLAGGGQSGLMFVMGNRVTCRELPGRADATAAYAEALQSEQAPVLDELDLELAGHFSRDATREGEDRTATGLAGGAWMVGAAFAPQTDKIMTLAMFSDADTGWRDVAIQLLVDPDAVNELGSSAPFPEVGTAFAWFKAHQESLPTPLRTWREAAEEALARASAAPPQRPAHRGGDPRKAKRRAARSTRRKNRR